MCFSFMLPWEDLRIRHMWSGFGKFSPRGGNTWLCCVIWQFLSLWFYEQMENVALDSSLCFKLLPFSAIHVFSQPLTCSLCVSCFFSQTHGSGRPEELHLLAEGERRRHSVCRAGLRHVQSASQTAVIRQNQTSPLWSFCWLCPFSSHHSYLGKEKTHKDGLTHQPGLISWSPWTNVQTYRYLLYKGVWCFSPYVLKRGAGYIWNITSVCKCWRRLVCWFSLGEIRHE